MRKSIRIILLLASTCSSASDFAEMTDTQISTAIAQLGADQYKDRESATEELFREGISIVPQLRVAAKVNDDAEIRARATMILERFKIGVFADTPPDVADLAEKYFSTEPSSRLAILQAMAQKDAYGFIVLSCLVRLETDPFLLSQMRQRLTAESNVLTLTASNLIARGHNEKARRLLEAGAETGDAIAVMAYAAYQCDHNALDKSIQRWQKRYERNPAESFTEGRTLFHLYRANHQLDKAAEMADKLGENDLQELVSFETSDWKKFIKYQSQQLQGPGRFKKIGLQAMVSRYAGLVEESDKILDQILKEYDDNRDVGNDIISAQLLNGRYDQAIKLMTNGRQFVQVFRLLELLGRTDEALAIANRPEAEKESDYPELAAASARILWRRGQKKEVTELISKMAQRARSLDSYAPLLHLEWEISRVEPQLVPDRRAHLIGAGGTFEDAPLEGRPSGYFINELFPDKADRAAIWWGVVAPPVRSTPEQYADALELLFDAVSENVPKDKWDTIINSVDHLREPPTGNLFQAMQRMEVVMEALEKAGEKDKAAQCFTKLREAFAWAPDGNRQLLTFIPVWEAKHKHWELAIRDSEICAAKLGGAPDMTWLHGWVVKQAGAANAKTNLSEAESHALMTEAIHRTLGNEIWALHLAEMMQTFGETEQAGKIWERMLHFSEPRQRIWYEAVRQRSQMLTDADPRRASELWRQYQLIVLDADVTFTNPAMYVSAPLFGQYLQARSLVSQGRIKEAVAEIQQLMQQLPTGTSYVYELVPMMKQKGYAAEARQIYDASAARLRANCEKYPGSWNYRNELAWLSVRCDYDLPQALKIAQEAVDLQPRDTASIDTLAEVHLRSGNRNIAMELIRKCETLEPNIALHRERRAEFEKYKSP